MQGPPPVYETYYQAEPFHPAFARFLGTLLFWTLVVTFLYEPLLWVDQHTFPLFGYIFYPLEWVLNKVVFPHAVTPLRGNVGAVLVASCWGLGIVLVVFAVRLTIRILRGMTVVVLALGSICIAAGYYVLALVRFVRRGMPFREIFPRFANRRRSPTTR